MKNTVVFMVTYLFFMLPTYLWRFSIFSIDMNSEVNADNIANTITWLLFINYIILSLVVYARGKAINKKYIVTFPVVAGFFDVILAFIPLVPTVMNIITIITAVSENKSTTNSQTK